MTICVETVQKYGLDDYRTPVFVFERLSSIVYPEANDIGEFLLALEKDPQQEDFLQGRGCGTTSCVVWYVYCPGVARVCGVQKMRFAILTPAQLQAVIRFFVRLVSFSLSPTM